MTTIVYALYGAMRRRCGANTNANTHRHHRHIHPCVMACVCAGNKFPFWCKEVDGGECVGIHCVMEFFGFHPMAYWMGGVNLMMMMMRGVFTVLFACGSATHHFCFPPPSPSTCDLEGHTHPRCVIPPPLPRCPSRACTSLIHTNAQAKGVTSQARRRGCVEAREN